MPVDLSSDQAERRCPMVIVRCLGTVALIEGAPVKQLPIACPESVQAVC
jgi:hypothetical protein